MIPVLSRDQMRAFDAHAIECHVPGLVLMENAGRCATDVLARELLGGDPRGARVLIVAGAGNNGGDGFVMARHLRARGAELELFLTGTVDKLRGDARANADAWLGLGGNVVELGEESSLDGLGVAVARADVLVDALFGTGLDRPIKGKKADIVAIMNAARASRLAVDIASGVDADTGSTLGVAICADVTVTFAHYKLGLLTPNGARLCGRTFVVDIGVPPSLAERVGIAAHAIETSDVCAWLAPRALDVHKNNAGHVLVMGGSPGKIGAALLASRASLRGGAGLVTLASFDEAAALLEQRVVEVMTARIDGGAIRASVEALVEGRSAVVLGPGFGLDERAAEGVAAALSCAQCTVVCDADALTLVARSTLARRDGPWILTPHPAEAARLLGTTTADIERDRFVAVRALAAKYGAIVVLKGAHSLVAATDGRVVVNRSGSPALATAGSGDVLAGLVAAFASSLSPFDAACAAVHVHGLAAEAWSRGHGDRGLLASEIADGVPGVLGALTVAHSASPR